LRNLKFGYLIKENRDHKQVVTQDEDTGNLQILLAKFKIPILTAVI